MTSFAPVAAGGLLALTLFGGACERPPPLARVPVVRLGEHGLLKRQSNVPPRCAAGDEFRPSIGCPPLLLLDATLEKRGPDVIRVASEAPQHLRGKEVLILPTLRISPGTTPRRLSPQVVAEVGETIALDVPFETRQLEERSHAQLRGHVLESRYREFVTLPVQVPPDAELRTGIAVASFAEAAGEGSTEFLLEAHWPGGERALLRESIPATSGGRWHDHRIDLADLAEREVTFHFITTTEAHAEHEHSSAAYPIWGGPEIFVRRPRDGRRNVVLISLDTVRADYLGGAPRDARLTPWFDRLASEGTSFRQAISTFSSTTAAHMSLFTGLYPVVHKVRYASHRLAFEIPTLPQFLAEAGYSTAAVTENAMLLAGSGFARGFDSYRENRDTLKHAGSVDRTFAEGVDWLEKNTDALFFLFLHTYEAHSPYKPSDEALRAVPPIDPAGLGDAERKWENLRRLYAAEVRYTDGAVERLFSELQRLDLLDDTMVVITSDHGEELGDHGLLGHAKTVYDEVLRVPLLFWDPGHIPAGRKIEEQVSLVDVAPTILELVDVPPPAKIPGRSLVQTIHGAPPPDDEVRFAEGLVGKVRMATARTRRYKWIWREDQPHVRVYDLRTDPDERSPLRDPELQARGRDLIETYLALDAEAGPDENHSKKDRVLDQDTREKLEALGYVE